MFITAGNGTLINMDRIAKIHTCEDDFTRESVIIFYGDNGEELGAVRFKNKDNFNKYVDKYLKPLLNNDIKDKLSDISGALNNIDIVLSNMESKL